MLQFYLSTLRGVELQHYENTNLHSSKGKKASSAIQNRNDGGLKEGIGYGRSDDSIQKVKRIAV